MTTFKHLTATALVLLAVSVVPVLAQPPSTLAVAHDSIVARLASVGFDVTVLDHDPLTTRQWERSVPVPRERLLRDLRGPIASRGDTFACETERARCPFKQGVRATVAYAVIERARNVDTFGAVVQYQGRGGLPSLIWYEIAVAESEDGPRVSVSIVNQT